MNFRFLLILSFFSLPTLTFSQKYIQKADAVYTGQKFCAGVEDLIYAYDKIARKGPKAIKEKGALAFRIAESYNATEMIREANEWYDRAILLEYFEVQPVVYLLNGNVLRMMSEVDKAEKNYHLYKELNPTDPRGDVGLASCKSIKNFKENKTTHIIESQTSLNKEGFDMAPMFSDSKSTKLFFSSNRTGGIGAEEDPRTCQTYMDLWESEMDKKGHWGEPKLITGQDINTEDSEGTVCFDSRFKMMFFTRCPNEKKKNLGCEIWMSEAKGKGEWGAPTKVLLAPNDSITVGHPCVSDDGKYLIFVSDLPGGFGGRDLWYSTFDRKTSAWSLPTNLGPEINTPGDELFPTFAKNGNLYFASSGYVGMGGLDIFVANKVGTEYKWENPKNMGYPINSEHNDYSLIEFTDKMGFFTSERKNSSGGDSFKPDIYSYDLPPNLFDLKVIVSEFGQKTNRIPDVKVTIKGPDANSSWEGYTKKDGSIFWDKKPNGDRYLSENMTFKISISKEDGFKPNLKTADITTMGLTSNQSFIVEMALLPVKPIIIRLPEVRYPLGKYTLLVDSTIHSKDSLLFVYNLLNEHPGLTLELSSHTDSRGSNEANQILSENRAKECVRYLVEEKGIDARRIVPVGKGEYNPATYIDPETGEKILLTEEFINKFRTTNKVKFEQLHALNRRTEGKVLSLDFDPLTAPPLSTDDQEIKGDPQKVN
jgi:peptidoglycan-associated lipoprotein